VFQRRARNGRTVAAAALGLTLAASLAVLGPLAPSHSVAAGDPVIAAAGDIACDPLNGGFNNGAGTTTDCLELATSNLLPGADAVLALGDEQYGCGGASAFAASYDPTWGKAKAITFPVPGNHEYQTTGGSGCSANADAAGYYSYFGTAAGEPSKGYYSFDLGQWHLIALNSECANVVGGCGVGSPQEVWLKNDLAQHSSASCTLAYWHRPRFYSYGSTSDTTTDPFWRDLYAAHADVILNGHQHFYERFALQNPDGKADPNGLREIMVGTGGESYMDPSATKLPLSEATVSRVFGILQMTLHPGSYDWSFLRVPNSPVPFTDSGTTACHNAAPAPDVVPPTSTIACNGAPCSANAYTGTVSVTLTASDSGGSGVRQTTYTTDGTDPATSATAHVYSSPVPIAQTTTVTYASVDNAGNQEPARSQLVEVAAASDTTAPVTAITCQGASCLSGWYTSPVSITLTASDAGSGVRTTTYTTDGTNPKASATAVVYTGAFSVPSTSTVKFYSVDNGGNVEATKSRLVRIDAAAPTVSITTPSDGSSFARRSTITITAAASDSGTGTGTASGVARVRFYRGSTSITTDSSSPYTVNWNTKSLAAGTYSLTAVATDVAGNVTTSSPVRITLHP
jgi:Bacterial Ig domain/Chitobiase/beta-hexosaminidase C-terminal domain/Calcineurin-like phosphoesterase